MAVSLFNMTAYVEMNVFCEGKAFWTLHRCQQHVRRGWSEPPNVKIASFFLQWGCFPGKQGMHFIRLCHCRIRDTEVDDADSFQQKEHVCTRVRATRGDTR